MPVLYDPSGIVTSSLDIPTLGGDFVMDRGMVIMFKEVHANETDVETALDLALGL